MLTCNAVGPKAQGRWSRDVRCWRSLPGTLAQGRAARPPAALEFARDGRWVQKALVKVQSQISGIVPRYLKSCLTSESGSFGLLKKFKTTMC